MIKAWLQNPYPLWNKAISQYLVSGRESLSQFAGYSIENILTGRYNVSCLFRIELQNPFPLLELPTEVLNAFYHEHGLEPLTIAPGRTDVVIKKLNSALDLIKLVPPAFEDIIHLVRTIQIIKSDHPENDVSFSHPKIPFSIFVSLCEDDLKTADLRVAESVIHEAMHLKLTLIENRVLLVESNSKDVFYSPWRDELRPISGVLHGLFVFRVILGFYEALRTTSIYNTHEYFLSRRISTIVAEFDKLSNFVASTGFTEHGRIFVTKLLQHSAC